jgi:histidinol-phosphate aminotransferase
MQHDNHDAIRAGVRAASPIGRSKVDESLHRMQWNESPQDFPADLKEDVLQRLAAQAWSRYPVSGRPWPLIDALATQMRVAPDQVVVSEGSADLIKAVMAAALRPGDAVVLPAPTFLLYRQNVRLHEANVVEIPLDPATGFALPIDALIDAAQTQRARLVTLCAPNNPTGTVYAVSDLRRLAAAIAPTLLVIDEAYAEFCDQDLTGLLDLDNVILLRTFSKFYAMAGVRVGYALTTPALAAELQKVITVFPLSVFSEITALVALEHRARFLSLRDQTVAERARMADSAGGVARRDGLSQRRQFSARTTGSPQTAAAPAFAATASRPHLGHGRIPGVGGLCPHQHGDARAKRPGHPGLSGSDGRASGQMMT